MVRLRVSQYIIYCVICVVPSSLACAFYLVTLYGDAHFVNRIGALLCGVGALLVFGQVAVEVAHASAERKEHEVIANDDLKPINRERALRKLALRESDRVAERYRVVMAISLLIFCGEILHGWGDILYYIIFGGTH